MTGYVHGYGTREQQRLIEQAEHWRHGLICEGTRLEPGTRVLEVGCGVGAVLAVLGQEYPGVRLHGIDLEPKQLEFARGYLERSGVEATLVEGEALALPFEDESFDHVWMMWFLEHVPDPPAALREARRILVPGGGVTAIEVDYVQGRTVDAGIRDARPRDGPRHGGCRLERRGNPASRLAPRGRLP
jgi:ubiquinone/menaquinone biosynthesis C-methylase UbiE